MIMICLIVVVGGVFIEVISIINKYINNIINFNFTYIHKECIIKEKHKKRKEKHMNKIILIGRLTDDPEIGYFGPDSAYARYTLAVTRTNGEDADFIRCTSFGRNAEVAEEYLRKGMKIAISGRLEINRYDGEGGTRYYTNVLVDSQEFCEKKSDSDDSASKGKGKPSASKGKGKPYASKGKRKDGFMDIEDGEDDEDLPFN